MHRAVLGASMAVLICAACSSGERVEPTPYDADAEGNNRPTLNAETPVATTTVLTTSSSPTPSNAAPCVRRHAVGDSIPTGAAIVWSDCDGVWALRSGRHPARLTAMTPRGSMRVSPNGRWVAFDTLTGEAHPSIRVVPVANGEVRTVLDGARFAEDVALMPTSVESQMPDGAAVEVKHWNWLPDSSGLAFTAWDIHRWPNSMRWPRIRNDLWRVSLDGERPEEVLGPGDGGHFAWSPDGRHVAITQSDWSVEPPVATIAVAAASGADRRELFSHIPMSSDSDWIPYQQPLWTSDSEHLLVVDPRTRYGEPPYRFYRLALDGSKSLIAEAAAGSLDGPQNYHAYWSPDRRRVAFLRQQRPPARHTPSPSTTAYPAPTVEQADIGKLLVITTTVGVEPIQREPGTVALGEFDWSPDSRRYAYRRRSSFELSDPLRRNPSIRVGGITEEPVDVATDSFASALAWLAPNHLLVEHGNRLELVSFEAGLHTPEHVTVLSGADSLMLDVVTVR